MAGSRLEKVGTIFSRVTGLLRSGTLKEEDRPIWYDVYKAFPPKYEPTYKRPVQYKEIKPIFYKEDIIRAKFYKKHASNFGLVDMLSPNSKPVSERFIEKYIALEKEGVTGDLFQVTEEALRNEGMLTIQKRTEDNTESVRAPKISDNNETPRQPIAQVKMRDIFKEDS